MEKIIYADNAATTQMDIEAFEAMTPFMLENFGNASQPYSFSRVSKLALKKARQTIARCINANPDEILFTSGGTESNNWVIKCFGFPSDTKHIITTNIEHHSILNACKSANADVFYLEADENGFVHPEDLEAILSKEHGSATTCEGTILVSVMFANNEIGTIQPIGRLAEAAHSYGAIFHTDAVQAVGHTKVDVKKLGVDMLSASAHKFNGPKGIGFLYIKHGTKLLSFMHGGRQEQGLRAGTENIAAIVGMSVALKNNIDHLKENQKLLVNLEKSLFTRLQKNGFSENVDYFRNGNTQDHIDGNVSISFKGIDGEMLLHRLDLMGISVSTGAACDSVKTKISHVIAAIGLSQEIAKGTIRISFGKNNAIDDAIYIADCITKIIKGMS